MDYFKAHKSILLLIGGLLLVCLILLFLAFSLIGSDSSSPQSTTSVTPNQTVLPTTQPLPSHFYSDDYISGSEKINREERTQLRKDQLVSTFQNALPYHGKYMSVYYTVDNNQVVLMIDSSHQQQANSEFDELLKKYNITRSSLPNVGTAFIEPTPGP